MAVEVFMPKAGMDMQEGTIIRWLAAVGDRVEEGDPLLEIETDKVSMEVEAPASGVLLTKYFDDGSVVPVVTVIGYIGEAGEHVPDAPTMAGGQVRAEDEAILKKGSSKKDERDFPYRVAVIGSGPAGYMAAVRAGRMGAKTILFEGKKLGGTCTNVGCIPMKTYNNTARDIDDIRKSRERGIVIGDEPVRVDMQKVHDFKDSVTVRMGKGVATLLKDAAVEVVPEEALLIGPHTIRAGQKTYQAEQIILASGSLAQTLTYPGVDQPEILISDGMFDLTEVPDRLVIVGGGVIGCEMASAFSRFGSKVTVVEQQEYLVPTFDREVSEAVRESFLAAGITVINGGKIERFDRRNDHPVVVLVDGRELEADLVLMAVGRKPNLACLGVMKDRLDYERGKIMVDEYCRTNIPHIFACGDISNRSIHAHSAMKMGDAAASTACGRAKSTGLNRAPLCLYGIPEAAGIGLTEREARKRGDIMIGRFPFAYNGRAVAMGKPEGFVKVIADRAYGEILGVHIVGAAACEMIVEAKTMMDMEITVYEVAEIMHPHPTFSEAFMEACADAISDCLNLVRRDAPAQERN